MLTRQQAAVLKELKHNKIYDLTRRLQKETHLLKDYFEGETLLFIALSLKRYSVFYLLLSKGASSQQKNIDGLNKGMNSFESALNKGDRAAIMILWISGWPTSSKAPNREINRIFLAIEEACRPIINSYIEGHSSLFDPVILGLAEVNFLQRLQLPHELEGSPKLAKLIKLGLENACTSLIQYNLEQLHTTYSNNCRKRTPGLTTDKYPMIFHPHLPLGNFMLSSFTTSELLLLSDQSLQCFTVQILLKHTPRIHQSIPELKSAFSLASDSRKQSPPERPITYYQAPHSSPGPDLNR